MSISLVITQMQIKITLVLSPMRLAEIQKLDSSLCWQVCGDTGSLTHCWRNSIQYIFLWRGISKHVIKHIMHLSFNPIILILRICSKHIFSTIQKYICTSLFNATFFIVVKYREHLGILA